MYVSGIFPSVDCGCCFQVLNVVVGAQAGTASLFSWVARGSTAVAAARTAQVDLCVFVGCLFGCRCWCFV